MQRTFLVAIAALLICCALAGCGRANSDSNSNQQPPAGQPTQSGSPTVSPSAISSPDNPSGTSGPDPSSATEDQLIREQIDSMTLEQKVGQLAIIGLEGTTMDESTKQFIQKYHVGGFILFKDNIASANQILKLLNQLKETNAKEPNAVPLWLSVDQEGGKVSRMPSEFKKTPSAQKIASKNDPDYTYAIGQSLGLELGALGFNMDFAPVLDINSNTDNPVIGDRSFGADSDSVILHGLEMMNGISSQGVASVVKHFPGHGDTSIDSHHSLPAVNKSLDELSRFELLPFQEAIRNDADAIMVGHLLMTKLDDEHPASISREVITGLLRERMGYDGVVMTDDMTMKGLTGGNDIGDAAVKAILAGGDVLLVCHEYNLQQKVLDTVKQRVEDGTISNARLDESVYRILRLKSKYQLRDEMIPSIDLEAVNAAISDSLDESGSNAKN
ncbi:beta-N-acetylhexosaminidase [Paenibacillus sp. LHD-117]|uniref:beta-N-acetylhexosaminidase n=1 Tax=Paenibacillus sp. LHD-117 TaxID=3071412 RepID=UPI0027DEF43C|nr:beta-N-acetylhexosaminidase [Paenibacillus sp. LHD-117]MDQ6421776.1 beta-N-acetylhexosaminidase [Paenibacillus sp. LHD-117]